MAFGFNKKNKVDQKLIDSVSAKVEEEASKHIRFFELSSVVFSLEARLYPERIPKVGNMIAELYMIWESAHNKINTDASVTAELTHKSFSKRMRNRRML